MLEQSPTQSPTVSQYTCHVCGYKSARLNVIILHNKSHSNKSDDDSPQGKKPKSPKKGRKSSKMTFAHTSSIEEDLALIRQGLMVSESDTSEEDIEEKEGYKKETPKRKRIKGPNKKSKMATSSAICNNLLADWGDSDSNEDEEILVQKQEVDEKKDEKKNEKFEMNENGKGSCFDFEEEEETTPLEKSPGRKIPRVIPQKRKSSEISDHAESESEMKQDKKKTREKSEKDFKQLQNVESTSEITKKTQKGGKVNLSDSKMEKVRTICYFYNIKLTC